MRRGFKLWIATILLIPLQLHAYDIKYITTRDGLTNSSVLSLCLKKNGQLAIGTCDGINAFDGINAWRLTPVRSNDYIRGNIIECMAEGKDGELWILTNHGLNRMINDQGVSNTFYDRFEGLRNIRKNASGDIFILDDERLHYIIDAEAEFKELYLEGITTDVVCDYAITDTHLLLFTQSGIVRYTLERGEDSYSLVDVGTKVDSIPIIFASKVDDTEYIITRDGILKSYHLSSGQTQSLIDLSSEMDERGIVSSFDLYKGQLVVGFSNNGVMFFTPDEQGEYTCSLALDGSGVFSLEKDEANNIVWMGTDGQGLCMYSEPPFSHTSFTYSDWRITTSKPVRAIFLDHEQSLWLGTKGGGIIEFPSYQQSQTPHQLPRHVYTQQNSQLADDRVYDFVESSLQGFWICTETGLNFYSNVKGQIIDVDITNNIGPRPLRYITSAFELDSILWIATAGDGVYRARIGGTSVSPRITELQRYALDGGKRSSNYFFGIAHDGEGKVWLANRGLGVFAITNGRLTHVPYRNSYEDRSVNDVFAVLPVGGDLWIGTGNGIIIQHADGRETHLTTVDGLPNNTIHALTADGSEHIFATTNNGIACFNNGSLIPTVLNSNMSVTEYSDGAVLTTENTIYFGGVNGISMLMSNKDIAIPTPAPRLDLTHLNINDRTVNLYQYVDFNRPRPRITLSHKQNSFKLGVSTMDYVQAPNTQYYYRLSDKEQWYNTGNSNTISLFFLHSGTHTLQVKYVNRISGHESPTFLYDIRITPPWYFSTLAICIYTLILLSIVITIWYLWWHRVKGRQQVELMRMQKRHADKIHEERLNFLTNVVHELNTPLTLIYGPCERIMGYAHSDAFIRKYMQLIMQNLKRLNFLIQEIIDFRRITTGHHSIEIHRVDASSVIDDVAESWRNTAEENAIQYETHIAESVIWNTDERALLRIASNLVSNAFKYTKCGGTIRILFAKDESNPYNPLITLSVYNTGKGITPEQQAHIFDYYSVFETVNESSVRGLTSRNGLGMSICYKMVKKLGGNITIDSEVGQYAQFNVTLPMGTLSEGANDEVVVIKREFATPIGEATTSIPNMPDTLRVTSSEHVAIKPATTSDGTPYTILIIDDNPDILDMLTDCLTGYTVIRAKSAEEGFDKMKETLPDLIISDIMMPGIGGLDFTQSVKQNKHTMHIPLIILSAKGSEDERIEGIESGADIYISKPFNIQYLLINVRRLLENSKVLKEYYNTSASAYTYASGKLVKNEERDFINDVVRIINDNLTTPDFTPEALASELGMSARNLYRKFSELDLPTPNNYIKAHKMETAARLIITTDMTIQEIIYHIGINTRSQFYSEFRKHFNMTPKQYREEHNLRDDTL